MLLFLCSTSWPKPELTHTSSLLTQVSATTDSHLSYCQQHELLWYVNITQIYKKFCILPLLYIYCTYIVCAVSFELFKHFNVSLSCLCQSLHIFHFIIQALGIIIHYYCTIVPLRNYFPFIFSQLKVLLKLIENLNKAIRETPSGAPSRCCSTLISPQDVEKKTSPRTVLGSGGLARTTLTAM